MRRCRRAMERTAWWSCSAPSPTLSPPPFRSPHLFTTVSVGTLSPPLAGIGTPPPPHPQASVPPLPPEPKRRHTRLRVSGGWDGGVTIPTTGEKGLALCPPTLCFLTSRKEEVIAFNTGMYRLYKFTPGFVQWYFSSSPPPLD
jgi:hypothetical protein